MTVHRDEDFQVRQTIQRQDGYPCVQIVPPDSNAIALAARIDAAARRAMMEMR